MKTLPIDFAPHSLARAARRTHRITWVFTCIGLALCASAAVTAFDLAQQEEAQQADVRQAQSRLARSTARKPVAQKFVIPDAQAAAVNSSIAQLNLPWRDVFDAVEAATPPTIALLSMAPDAKKHLLKGVAEAKTSDGMISYIEELKKQEFFDAVLLTRHELNEQDPNRPIRFQFEAKWTEQQQ